MEQLECELEKGLKVVIACGMWGNPGTSKAMLSLSERFNVPVLEDAAQSFGASTPCGREGLKGRIGCFSTHEYKLLSTGEGGFITTNDADIAERLRAFIRLGFDGKGYGNRPSVNYKLSGFHPRLFKPLDLNIEGLLAEGVSSGTPETWSKDTFLQPV
ncbi:DegT/DnrJ/EryC1/StrS family aminotransferase [Serratia silvae]|uniref:DegT/DnrJ/EryC1/StrS family aminotransferase n=1 Tax=Serratia silvae TaxID=2824122 RepID=A0ABT0KF88_9GAMM|nr:DegT/DnrJ/EryC1/StrS family aminotransferase [Serratia silvae]MCL1030698.1 DegT/DnrJ/EryC1/StrS family aminotransferase [Serratia silvae]